MRNYSAELFDLIIGNNEEQFKRTCQILYKCVYIFNHSITQGSSRSNFVQVFKFSIILLPKVALAPSYKSYLQFVKICTASSAAEYCGQRRRHCSDVEYSRRWRSPFCKVFSETEQTIKSAA